MSTFVEALWLELLLRRQRRGPESLRDNKAFERMKRRFRELAPTRYRVLFPQDSR